VDVADYDLWAANVGASDPTLQTGDINSDGLVDVADYDIWAANVGAPSTAPSTTPGAVTNLTATVASSYEVDLTWTPNYDGNTGYVIYGSTDPGGPDAGWYLGSYATITDPTASRYNVTGLQPNTPYYFQVVSYNLGGMPADNPGVCATTTLAGTVGIVSVTEAGNTPTVNLTLADQSLTGGPTITSFDVYRSDSPGELGSGTPIATNVPAGPWSDPTTTVNNQWYYYSIYAAGSVPEGNPTSQTPVETPTAPPVSAAVLEVTDVPPDGNNGERYFIGYACSESFGQPYWPAPGILGTDGWTTFQTQSSLAPVTEIGRQAYATIMQKLASGPDTDYEVDLTSLAGTTPVYLTGTCGYTYTGGSPVPTVYAASVAAPDTPTTAPAVVLERITPPGRNELPRAQYDEFTAANSIPQTEVRKLLLDYGCIGITMAQQGQTAKSVDGVTVGTVPPENYGNTKAYLTEADADAAAAKAGTGQVALIWAKQGTYKGGQGVTPAKNADGTIPNDSVAKNPDGSFNYITVIQFPDKDGVMTTWYVWANNGGPDMNVRVSLAPYAGSDYPDTAWFVTLIPKAGGTTRP
jgi:hypothetical protein